MAREFLRLGDHVLICGRDADNLNAAMDHLRSISTTGELYGMICDITVPEQCDELANRARTVVFLPIAGASCHCSANERC